MEPTSSTHTGTIAACAECGHLHYLGAGRYCSCPIEGCDCPGQPPLSHAVVRSNFRTGARYIMAWMPSAAAAERRAAGSNELHRTCKMTHLLDRAISGSTAEIRRGWSDHRPIGLPLDAVELAYCEYEATRAAKESRS